jgi:creatinine amidohydrolase
MGRRVRERVFPVDRRLAPAARTVRYPGDVVDFDGSSASEAGMADVRAALAAGAPAYLFVNPIEYHGPHLSLRNDLEISRGLARDLHDALVRENPAWGTFPMVAPRPLDVGVDPAPGPGTIAVPFREVCDRVVTACDELADLGARRVLLMTFHGSPLHSHALFRGEARLRARGVLAMNPLNLVLRELMKADGARYAEAFAHVEDVAERDAMIRGLGQDFHAGFGETSLALHYAPQTVDALYTRLPPCPPFAPTSGGRVAKSLARLARLVGAAATAEELGLVADGLGWYALRPFPGYTGRPHRATAQAGQVFAREMLAAYVTSAREVLADRGAPPPPIMPWLPLLSFGGRVGSIHVPLDAVLRVA